MRFCLFALATLGLCFASASNAKPLPLAARTFLLGLPKAELHVHLEGTLLPAQYLDLVARNGLEPRYATVAAVEERLKYQQDLNSFIEVYEELLSALRTEDDFHATVLAYVGRVATQGVRHVEMFFDPQMHTTRGIPLDRVLRGLVRAKADAASQFGVSLAYIACFNRDRPAESALALLPELAKWREPAAIIGIGLDNPEELNFPVKFAPVFAEAAKLGFRLTSHCDVNVPNTLGHIKGAMELLGVERIDHGLNVVDDPSLVAAARERGIGFSGCVTLLYRELPGRLEARSGAVRAMLDAGLVVCLNSDDPGLMRGLHVGDLYVLTAGTGLFSREDMVRLARNSFTMSWIDDAEKAHWAAELDSYLAADSTTW